MADAFGKLRNKLELKIGCGHSQVPVLQSIKVDPSFPSSLVKMQSHGKGGFGSALLRHGRVCEYPHLILSSNIF